MNALSVSSLLADEYVLQILSATWSRPMTANEISLKYNIPIATCYRKIRELEKNNLMTCTERIVTRDGRRRKKYLSQISSISIFFYKGELRVELQRAYKEKERMVVTFQKLVSPNLT